MHYDEDLISRGGSTGKGRVCDLMQRYPPTILDRSDCVPVYRLLRICNPEADSDTRSNLVNFWRELGELVDDTVMVGSFLKQPVCELIKSGDLQFFVSAIIGQRPSNVEGFREAWTLVISAEARIIDPFWRLSAQSTASGSARLTSLYLGCVASWVVRLRRLLSWV